MQEGDSAKEQKGLIGVLGFLVVAIVGLVVGIVVVSNNNGNNAGEEVANNEIIDTSEAMAGWEGSIADSTKATVLTEEINEKLRTEPSYNPPQAIVEYDKVYNESEGELKVYVAIEYANYVYRVNGDLEKSVGILKGVEKIAAEKPSTNVDYLYALCGLYDQAGDTQTADYYRQIIIDNYTSDEPIKMMEYENE